MARLTIDTGTAGNTATGDSLRGAFTKVNANFEEIYNELGASGILSDLSFAGNTISTDGTNQNLILDPNGTGKVIIEGTVDLGGLSIASQTITGLTTNSNITLSPAGTGAVDVDTSRIINVSDPSSAQDAATKNYVDAQVSGSATPTTFVGDDSTGTAVNPGETFKFAGTQNITTAVSGDTLTITGPDLSSYATTAYVDSQNTAQALTFVGDDSTGTAVNSGETFKIAGAGTVTTAVSGDTLTITGTTSGTGVFDSVRLTGGDSDQGTLTWNNVDRTLDLTQGDVTLQLGQETHFIVRNATGSTIPNGTFVGFTGVTDGSNRIEVSPFDASTMEEHQLVGFATENISNGVNGIVTTFGYVRGNEPALDTRGTESSAMAVGDEDWSVGDILYPHPTVAGKLTTQEPASGFKAKVAVVTNRHETRGEIFVRVTPHNEEFDEKAGTAFGWGNHATAGYLTNSTVTLVGDDSTGATLNTGETFKFAGAQNITTAVSGDTLTITGPDLSVYATQSYVDSASQGLDVKNSVKLATTSELTNEDASPPTYDNGTAGLGATLTFVSTITTIDGVSGLQNGDRILIKNQSDQATNGIYVRTSGTVYTRAVDADTAGDITGGTFVFVEQGTVNGDSGFVFTHNGTPTVGTTALTVSQFSGAGQITAGAGLEKSGNTLSVADGGITNSKLQNSGIIVVDDTSTASTISLGETLKIAGGTGITTAVSADTITITGTDLSSYLQNTGTQTIDNLTFNDNIIGTASNADLILDTGGTGQVVANSALKINRGYIEAINSLTSSSTITVDFSVASVHTVTLAENTQFVITNLPTGGTGTIIITQDGGGSNTGSFGTDGSTAVKFAGGTPTLSTAGNAIDVVTIFNDGVNYLGNIAKAYAA